MRECKRSPLAAAVAARPLLTRLLKHRGLLDVLGQAFLFAHLLESPEEFVKRLVIPSICLDHSPCTSFRKGVGGSGYTDTACDDSSFFLKFKRFPVLPDVDHA